MITGHKAITQSPSFSQPAPSRKANKRSFKRFVVQNFRAFTKFISMHKKSKTPETPLSKRVCTPSGEKIKLTINIEETYTDEQKKADIDNFFDQLTKCYPLFGPLLRNETYKKTYISELKDIQNEKGTDSESFYINAFYLMLRTLNELPWILTIFTRRSLKKKLSTASIKLIEGKMNLDNETSRNFFKHLKKHTVKNSKDKTSTLEQDLGSLNRHLITINIKSEDGTIDRNLIMKKFGDTLRTNHPDKGNASSATQDSYFDANKVTEAKESLLRMINNYQKFKAKRG